MSGVSEQSRQGRVASTIGRILARKRRPPLDSPAPPLAAILMVMLAQTVFLVWGCDWDLCGDEAEYWAWSRKLDWSYYSRGPVIAWLIRLGTEILGGLA